MYAGAASTPTATGENGGGHVKRIRSDIQGLRAIAVTSVVIAHAFPAVVTGGFVGVDVFFVISGFLITQIIVREIDAGHFTIRNFYVRRVRRILPALVPVILFAAIAGYFLLMPKAYADLGRNIVSTMLFVSNFDFWRSTNYFGTAAELQPLLHMWSLAVEEQYYLFFPPIVALVMRLLGRSWLKVLVGAAFLGSLACAEVLISVSPGAAYYLLPSRAFELMIGSMLALGMFPAVGEGLRQALSLLGLAMIAAAIALFSSATRFPGLAALLPCLGTALVIHCGADGRHSPGGRLISGAPFLAVGNLSYSWYLWHWPMLSFARNYLLDDFGYVAAIASVVVSYCAATLSYRFIEQPIAGLRNERIPYLRAGALGMGACAALGLVVMLQHGLPGRFTPAANTMFAAADDFNQQRGKCHDNGGARLMPYASNCRFGDQTQPADVAVWGDSHGAELAVALGAFAGRQYRSVLEITTSACPPTQGYSPAESPFCASRNALSLKGLLADSHVRTVVIATNAQRYRHDEPALEQGILASIDALLKSGKAVVVSGQVPIMRASPPVQLGFAVERGIDISHIGLPVQSGYLPESSAWNRFVRSLPARYAGQRLKIVDVAATLCAPDLCRPYDQRRGVLYFNADHLSLTGARYAFAPVIADIYGPQ
jgi:peptidoglycan/LPS O-acetylase OafA/YrhL